METNVVRFRFDFSDLKEAMRVASIVKPKALGTDGAGYLFVVRDGQCFIYSRGDNQVVRSVFPVTDVEGEGSFVYPAHHVKTLEYLEGSAVLEAKHEGETFTVSYKADAGASLEMTSFDPKTMATCDKELNDAVGDNVFQVGILRHALSLSKPFLPKEGDRIEGEQLRTIRIFDDSDPANVKGDGHLFACTGVQAFYYYNEAFKGKGLVVHEKNLGVINSFLSVAKGNVTMKTGRNLVFMVDGGGNVLGWSKAVNTHTKFAYYGLDRETIVIQSAKAPLMKALNFAQAALTDNREKVRITFERDSMDENVGTLRFDVLEGGGKAKSVPLAVRLENPAERDFSVGINIHQFIRLVEQMESNEVSIRVAFLSRGEQKEAAMFRTIDSFHVDANGKVVIGGDTEGVYECRVTRLAPSMD